MVKEELMNVLVNNDVINFDTYYPDGTHRCTHNMPVMRIEPYGDSITVYGSGEESETLRGTIEYDDEYECYSVTDEWGMITYVAAA